MALMFVALLHETLCIVLFVLSCVKVFTYGVHGMLVELFVPLMRDMMEYAMSLRLYRLEYLKQCFKRDAQGHITPFLLPRPGARC